MWTRKQTLRALTTIFAYGRSHYRFLAVGAAATVAVVALRLAMPWVLRGIVEVVFPGDHSDSLLASLVPSVGDPVVWFAGAFLVIAFLVGLGELVQRVNIKRFASFTVHDLRGEAVKGATRQVARREKGTGDLIARIIGDSARIKAGMSGILVHVFQNGLIFAGVCLVLFFVSWKLAAIFFVGGIAAIGVGLWMSKRVASTSRKMRRKEGKYAVWIQEQLDHGVVEDDVDDFEDADEINESSAKKDVKTTRLIARATLVAHVVLAFAVGVALWVGAQDVRAGTLSPGGFFIFVAYALTVQRRTVHIGRQAARAGKVLACANRIALLLEPSAASELTAEKSVDRPALDVALQLQGVRLVTGREGAERARLKKTDLDIEAGSRVLVLGDSGSGKSSLLQVLAGVTDVSKGKLRWDGERIDADSLRSRVAYLPQEPVFQRAPVSRVIGLANPEKPSRKEKDLLRELGLWDWIRALPERLEHTVASRKLARNESRALCLAGILLADGSPLWILDTPLDGLKPDEARERLKLVRSRAKGRTLVVALPTAMATSRFDKIVLLERGKIVFAGTPAEWKERKAALRLEVTANEIEGTGN